MRVIAVDLLDFYIYLCQDKDIAKGPKEYFILQFYRVGPLSFLKTYHKKEKEFSFEEFRDVWFRDIKPQSLQQSVHNYRSPWPLKQKLLLEYWVLLFSTLVPRSSRATEKKQAEI